MYDNPFLKKDSLVEAVKQAQLDGEIRRQAEAYVNEEFGVYSRQAVIREQLAAYDARIEEAYKHMKEGKPLDPVGHEDKDIDNDGDHDKSDKYLLNRRKVRSKAIAMKEADMRVGDPSADEPLKKAGNPPLMSTADSKGLNVAFNAVRQSKGMTPNNNADMVKEASMYANKNPFDPSDPSVQGGSDVTMDRAPKPAMKRHSVDSSYQGSGEVTQDGKPVSVRGGIKEGKKIDVYAAMKARQHAKAAMSEKDPSKKAEHEKKSAEYKAQIREGQIDEISKEKLDRYREKAFDVSKRAAASGDKETERKRDKGRSTAFYKLTGRAKVLAKEDYHQIDEAKWSHKAARRGEDIGKPGKKFAEIEKSAAERYGSEEAGKRVAGAVLARLRAKHMKEDQSF